MSTPAVAPDARFTKRRAAGVLVLGTKQRCLQMTSTDQPPENDNLPLWGAVAIGRVIGRNPRQTFNLLETGKLPAQKIGGLWVSTRKRLAACIDGEGS